MPDEKSERRSFFHLITGTLSAIWNMSSDPKKPTKQSLREILHHAQVKHWKNMDEVYPGIYIGDQTAAKDIQGLREAGITTPLGCNTSHQFYQIRSFPCEFLGIPALDIMHFKIDQFFEQTTEFIDSALKHNGKVLVHCYMGVSRSATVALAYLMMKKKMSAPEALKQLRTARNVYPNDGFLDQICELELKLKAKQ